jgi:uncharacterized protein YbcV (DUF1398 family)
MMNDIEKKLKAFGLKKGQIFDFFKFYKEASEKNIIYPFYYALTKVMV